MSRRRRAPRRQPPQARPALPDTAARAQPQRKPTALITIWPLSGAGLTLITLIVVGLVVGIVIALHGAGGSSGPPPFGTPLPAPSGSTISP